MNIGRSSFHQISQSANKIDKGHTVLELLATPNAWTTIELEDQTS